LAMTIVRREYPSALKKSPVRFVEDKNIGRNKNGRLETMINIDDGLSPGHS